MTLYGMQGNCSPIWSQSIAVIASNATMFLLDVSPILPFQCLSTHTRRHSNLHAQPLVDYINEKATLGAGSTV